MPIYEFRCRKCGADFELLVFGKAEPRCEACGTDDVAKKMSIFGRGVGGGPAMGGGCGGCKKTSCSTC
jgi:putative FmdB family regulatory protein